MANTKNTDECLYISFAEPKEKRKYILKGVKSSLEIQENILRIKEIRKAKTGLYKTLKKEMEELEEINKKLRTTFPNPNEIIPSVESESQLIQNDVDKLLGKKPQEKKTKKQTNTKKETKEKKTEQKETNIKEINTTHTKKLSKLERIKNNIQLIEEELKKVK